jgi:RNA polymerase sigma-70 factor (ECF subfamily)
MLSTIVNESSTAQMGTAPAMDAPVSDGALVAAAKRGDKEAFALLVKRHERRVLVTARRITGNQQDAEDAVQQCFQNAFVHLSRFEGKSAFSTWLTRIAMNEALMLLRKGRSLREISIDASQGREEAAPALEIFDSAPGPEISYSQREQRELLSAAMSTLRPSMRQAIELRDLRELSVSETAQVTGLSVPAVKARLFHARRKLREALRRSIRSAQRSTKRFSWGSHTSKNLTRDRFAYHSAGD